MTVNLESESALNNDPTQWTPLQTEICMKIACGKLDAFIVEACRVAELVRFGLLPRNEATDMLHEAATYNELFYDYGADHIQAIMSAAFAEVA